ncbi:MAG: hypothetical protein LBP30_04455 [Clostridiales Family XIII bacterium]|jgi:uncharacterized membrane protein|nr:hypothetical protein [Clostridiales Family XIII bacterium]
MSRKGLYAVSTAVFVAVVFFITFPPITQMLDRVRPRVLGFPFMQFWLLFIPLLLSVWLIIWFVLECRIEDREAAAEAEKGGEKNE